MRTIAHDLGTPPHSLWTFVLIMGGLELVLSQVRQALELHTRA